MKCPSSGIRKLTPYPLTPARWNESGDHVHYAANQSFLEELYVWRGIGLSSFFPKGRNISPSTGVLSQLGKLETESAYRFQKVRKKGAVKAKPIPYPETQNTVFYVGY